MVTNEDLDYLQAVMVLDVRDFFAAVRIGALAPAVALYTQLALASPADMLSWDALPDPAAQTYDDPFAELSAAQLQTLISVVRLRERLATGRQAERDDLRAAEKKLSELGVDADALISQRWAVAERRRNAASAGNPKLDGETVTIGGFAIPGPSAEDGTKIVYLVPQPGLCSHMPPPDPNQMLRLRLKGEWYPQRIHEPVAVTGRLHLDPTEHSFSVVDGLVRMNATWSMDVEAVDTSSPRPPPLSFVEGR